MIFTLMNHCVLREKIGTRRYIEIYVYMNALHLVNHEFYMTVPCAQRPHPSPFYVSASIAADLLSSVDRLFYAINHIFITFIGLQDRTRRRTSKTWHPVLNTKNTQDNQILD